MDGDTLTCGICGAEGVGIGFVHDCAVILRVEPNDDPSLSCLLCQSREHVPRPLTTTIYTPQGRSTWGLHRDCYDRARILVRGPLPSPSNCCCGHLRHGRDGCGAPVRGPMPGFCQCRRTAEDDARDAARGAPETPTNHGWWGVWCEQDGGGPGFWRGDGSEDMRTTETEAKRRAANANEFQKTRTDAVGWRYEARPYVPTQPG